MRITLEHDKALMGFVFAGNQPVPNNHRWFVQYYAGNRIYSDIHFDEAVLISGKIRYGTETWTENTQFGQNSHGRVTLPPDSNLVMSGGYRSKVFIGSESDVKDVSTIPEFDKSKPFGTIRWNRQKNNWVVNVYTENDEREFEGSTVVFQKKRIYYTKIEESDRPKVYLVFNFATMDEIESLGSTIVI